jgi:hypothetical protein
VHVLPGAWQTIPQKHLENRRQIALEEEDKEAFKKIIAIIQREHQHNFWRKLNYVTGKKKTRSAMSIQVEGQDGAIMEQTMQDAVKQTIFSEIHKKRYMLAGEAPICNGNLFQDFGYMATTPALCAVLDGTYVLPPSSDAATSELFPEGKIAKNHSPEDEAILFPSPRFFTFFFLHHFMHFLNTSP